MAFSPAAFFQEPKTKVASATVSNITSNNIATTTTTTTTTKNNNTSNDKNISNNNTISITSTPIISPKASSSSSSSSSSCTSLNSNCVTSTSRKSLLASFSRDRLPSFSTSETAARRASAAEFKGSSYSHAADASLPTPPSLLTPSISVEDFSDNNCDKDIIRRGSNLTCAISTVSNCSSSSASPFRLASGLRNAYSDSPDSAAYSGDDYSSHVGKASTRKLITVDNLINMNQSTTASRSSLTTLDDFVNSDDAMAATIKNDDDLGFDDNVDVESHHEASTKTLLQSQMNELSTPPASRQHRHPHHHHHHHQVSTTSSSLQLDDEDFDVDSSSDFGYRRPRIYQSDANGCNGSSTPIKGRNGSSSTAKVMAPPTSSIRHHSTASLGDFATLRVPIVGFETMEKRARLTVFKVHVIKGGGGGGIGGSTGMSHNLGSGLNGDLFDLASSSSSSSSPTSSSWFVFRRFNDFVRLRDKLQLEFPRKKFPPLPNKKWFNKFDHEFLVKRQQQLQEFIDELLRGCRAGGGGGSSS